MVHLRGLAVHELRRADDVAAKGCADGLMPKADAEDGRLCRPAKRWTSGMLMPASWGVQGPGESRMRSGSRASTSSTVSSSLRRMTMSAPSSPMYWTRL